MKTIEVKEIKGNFYGGLPYSVSWDFNGGESPSKLKISVVNEKGKYSLPSLSYSRLEKIKLDNFTFNGYLIGYNLNYSVGQKTLDLEYIDQSCILEKYFVLLHTKNANRADSKFDTKNTNLLVVGKPYHPCDNNMDSMITSYEQNKRDVDWCDPCPLMPPDKYTKTCDIKRANFEIFPVYYTFNELIDKIKKNNVISINEKYGLTYDNFIKRDYEGSLKNVLSSWCEDLGLSYYFDPTLNQLSFIDRSKKPIKIPEFTPNDNIDMIDLNVGASIENTFSRGYISTYEKVGENKSFECKNERIITTYCLTLQDLYIDGNNSSISGLGEDNNSGKNSSASYTSGSGSSSSSTASSSSSSQSSSSSSKSSSSSSGDKDASENEKAKNIADVEELLTAVSYLGEPAHNAFAWFWYYQIKTAEDITKKYVIKDYKEESTKEGQKKILKYFGNMKIRAVYAGNSEEEINRVHFVQCRRRMDKEKRSLLEAECAARGFKSGTSTEIQKSPGINLGYYFVVAEMNEEFFDKQVKVRMDRAENYLGRYWYRHLDINWLIPGGDNQNGQIEVSGPDSGSAKWYKTNEHAESLPIFGFGHESKSKVGKLFKDIPDSQLEIEKKDKEYWEKLKNFGPENSDLRKAASSFILMDRPTKWFPDKRSFINYESLFKWYSDVAPNIYSVQDGRPDFLFNLYPDAKNNANVKIFICRDLSQEPDKAFDSVEFSTVDHPLEAKKRQQLTSELQDGSGNTTIIKKGPWGLNGRKCVKIKLPGIDLFCPVQCFGNNEIIKDGYRTLTKKEEKDEFTRDITGTFVDLGTDDGAAGYRVFTTSAQTFYKVLPKLKYLNIKPPENLKEVGKVDYFIKDLSDEKNMDLFKRNRCLVTKQNFIDLSKKYEPFHAITQSDPFKKVSFKLAGVFPKKYQVEDGLVSIQISIGDDGVYTTYAFEDQIIKPPSDQVLSDYIKLTAERVPIGGQIPLTAKILNDYNTAISVSQQYGSVIYDINQ